MSTDATSTSIDRLDATRVGDVMHRGLVTCDPDTPLREVAEMMHEKRIHCLLVTDQGDEDAGHWGLVSDLDLIASAGGWGLTAEVVAQSPPLTVSVQDSVARAAALICDHRSTHLLVLDTSGTPAGVISTLDVAGVMSMAE